METTYTAHSLDFCALVHLKANHSILAYVPPSHDRNRKLSNIGICAAMNQLNDSLIATVSTPSDFVSPSQTNPAASSPELLVPESQVISSPIVAHGDFVNPFPMRHEDSFLAGQELMHEEELDSTTLLTPSFSLPENLRHSKSMESIPKLAVNTGSTGLNLLEGNPDPNESITLFRTRRSTVVILTTGDGWGMYLSINSPFIIRRSIHGTARGNHAVSVEYRDLGEQTLSGLIRAMAARVRLGLGKLPTLPDRIKFKSDEEEQIDLDPIWQALIIDAITRIPSDSRRLDAFALTCPSGTIPISRDRLLAEQLVEQFFESLKSSPIAKDAPRNGIHAVALMQASPWLHFVAATRELQRDDLFYLIRYASLSLSSMPSVSVATTKASREDLASVRLQGRLTSTGTFSFAQTIKGWFASAPSSPTSPSPAGSPIESHTAIENVQAPSKESIQLSTINMVYSVNDDTSILCHVTFAFFPIPSETSSSRAGFAIVHDPGDAHAAQITSLIQEMYCEIVHSLEGRATRPPSGSPSGTLASTYCIDKNRIAWPMEPNLSSVLPPLAAPLIALEQVSRHAGLAIGHFQPPSTLGPVPPKYWIAREKTMHRGLVLMTPGDDKSAGKISLGMVAECLLQQAP
jgi:hypothetical protein